MTLGREASMISERRVLKALEGTCGTQRANANSTESRRDDEMCVAAGADNENAAMAMHTNEAMQHLQNQIMEIQRLADERHQQSQQTVEQLRVELRKAGQEV